MAQTILIIPRKFNYDIASNLRHCEFYSMDINFNGIFAYSTTSTDDAAYIIGGAYRKMSQIIVEFKNDRWTRLRQFLK